MLKNINIITAPQRDNNTVLKLINIWEQSVEHTHNFISKQDIINLRPLVTSGLQNIQQLIIALHGNEYIGFMGIEDKKIEMLFLLPSYRGYSIGKQLVKMAINDYEVRFVDVNEQNPDAIQFYQACGFTVFDRKELDPTGNPFPILSMQLSSDNSICPYLQSDTEDMIRLFYDTVHTINSTDYNSAQLNVWAPNKLDRAYFVDKFNSSHTLVAKKGTIILGFANAKDDYLDMLYTHKSYQQQGIASKLLAAIEKHAHLQGFTKMQTHASITAKKFFYSRGYQIITEQEVVRNNIRLKNFIMYKDLV